MNNEDSNLLLTHMSHFVYIFPVHSSFSSIQLSSFIPKDWNLINYTSIYNMHPRMKLLDLGKRKGKGLVWARKRWKPASEYLAQQWRTRAKLLGRMSEAQVVQQGPGQGTDHKEIHSPWYALTCVFRYPTPKPTTHISFSHTLKSPEKHPCMGILWGICSTHLLQNII